MANESIPLGAPRRPADLGGFSIHGLRALHYFWAALFDPPDPPPVPLRPFAVHPALTEKRLGGVLKEVFGVNSPPRNRSKQPSHSVILAFWSQITSGSFGPE